MIKGIVLDVDGVLVGGIRGVNYPDPHRDVTDALKKIRQKGFPVVLCTGKGTFSIRKIVEDAYLDNPHIGDGGAITVDFLENKIIRQFDIEKNHVKEIVGILINNNIYTELYTENGYYIQKNLVCEKTETHTAILTKEPETVDDLADAGKKIDVIKIMPVAVDEEEKQKVIDLIDTEKYKLTLQWGRHLSASTYYFGIITRKGVSKRQSVIDISRYLNVPPEGLLGVGDGMTDWTFMEICGYKAAMGNGSKELKEKIRKSGKSGYIGGHVNSNGILDIFSHFGLLNQLEL